MAAESPTYQQQPLFISVEEAAKRLGISRITAKRAVLSGEIPSTKLRNRRLVPVVAIDRMVAQALGEEAGRD